MNGVHYQSVRISNEANSDGYHTLDLGGGGQSSIVLQGVIEKAKAKKLEVETGPNTRMDSVMRNLGFKPYTVRREYGSFRNILRKG